MMFGKRLYGVVGGNRPSTPLDLRESAPVDGPEFNRPLVYGRIDTGEVTLRWPGSDKAEKYVVKPREEESKTMATATSNGAMETTAAPAAETKRAGGQKVSPRFQVIVDMYNAGKSYRQIAEELGVAKVTVEHHLRRARELGVIQPRRPTAGGATIAGELEQRLCELEARLQRLEEAKGQAPGVAVLEDLSRELDSVKRELGILAGGLGELSARMRALEEQGREGSPDTTQQLLRLLELALTQQRRTA